VARIMQICLGYVNRFFIKKGNSFLFACLVYKLGV
jgi:hypothetical protein